MQFLYVNIYIIRLTFWQSPHGDYDHAGEALTIMESLDVKNVFFNSNELNDLEKKIFKESKNPYKLQEGDSFSLGNFNFLTLSNNYHDENDSSVVLYGVINGFKLLFMGDASIKSEEYIISKLTIQ